jgi:broad specificity phosphatase PhoE
MPPIVILIRHAQACHNETNKSPSGTGGLPTDNSPQDWSLPDPGLTERGFSQCRELERHLKQLDLAHEIQLIVTSPMLRTLQTTQSSLGWLMERGTPAICQGSV